MPWSDYPKDIRQFSTLIHQAAEARFGAAATVQIVAAAAKDAGITLGFDAYSAVSRLYGSWVAVRGSREAISDASNVVGRTGIDQGITGAMISRAPWSPTVSSTAQNPFVLVKGRYTMDSPTGPITGYFTNRYRLNELTTVSAVMSDMQAQMDFSNQSPDLSQASLEELVSMEWAP